MRSVVQRTARLVSGAPAAGGWRPAVEPAKPPEKQGYEERGCRGRESVAWRKLIALPALLLIVLAGHAGHQAPSPAGQDRDPESFRISVDVALVVLHATVTDRQGGFVSDLGEQDFEVYEDGVPQRIRLFRNEDVPVTVGLVVDHSTTMRPKLAEVTAAARTFVRSSNREDEMFVVNFNEKVSLGLPGAIRFTDSDRRTRKRDRGRAYRGPDGSLRRDRQGVGGIAGRQPGQESADRRQRWR